MLFLIIYKYNENINKHVVTATLLTVLSVSTTYNFIASYVSVVVLLIITFYLPYSTYYSKYIVPFIALCITIQT